jgi:type II secretory pathway predicted ATPase ExeA
MIHDVKEYFGLKRDFHNTGYFETENYRQVFLDIKSAVISGHLIALTGTVGCGKTLTARKIREELSREGDVLVSVNLAVDKDRVTLNTLMHAIFADMTAGEKNFKIPTQLESRERQLRDLIKRRRKPVVLFIDEAHDLHHKTLVRLKRLIEVIQEAESVLSIVLIGHPKLKVDLCRAAMEEIGARATILELEGISGSERKYIDWLLNMCLKESVLPTDIFTETALDLMADQLATPLQINSYAWKALGAAHQIGQKPVEAETLQNVITQDLNGKEARLHRFGYNAKSLGEAINVRPSEIRAYMTGHLTQGRSQEIQKELLRLGITGG